MSRPTARRVASWIARVRERPRTVVLAALMATLVSALYLNFGARSSGPEELLRKASRRDLAVLTSEFPYPDDLMVLVRGTAPQARERFLDDLEEKLSARPELFPNRLYKLSLAKLQTHLLLYLPVDQLKSLAIGLESMAPKLASGGTIISWLTGSAGHPSKDADGLRQLYLDKLEACLKSHGRAAWKSPVDDLLSPEQATLLRPFWEARSSIYLTLDDGRTHLMLVRPGRAGAVEGLRTLLRDAAKRNPEVEAELTGSLAIVSDQTGALARELLPTALFLLVVLLPALLLGLLQPVRLAASSLALACGLVLSGGWAAWLLGVGPIWLTSQALVLTLAGYLALHDGVESDAHHVFRLGGASTVAFAALALSPVGPVARLGWACAGGILLCTLALITIVPALEVLGLRARPREVVPFLTRTGRRPTRAILALTALLALVTLASLETTRFSDDPLAVVDADAPSLRTERELKGRGGSVVCALIMATDVAEAHQLTRSLKKLSAVREIFTLAQFFPEQESAKTAWISRIVNVARAARSPRAINLSSGADLEQLARAIPASQEKGGTDWGAVVARMGPGEVQDALQSYQTHLLEDYRRFFEVLRSQDGNPVEFGDLPEAVTQRLVGRSGRMAVLVFPKMAAGATLETFVTQLRTVAVRVGGPAVIAADLASLSRKAVQILPFTLGLGLLLALSLELASLLRALLVLSGPYLALLFTLGCLHHNGIPLNFLTWPAPAVVLLLGTSLSLGTLRRPRASMRALFPAVVVLLTALSLLPCGHPGLAGLGLVIALGMSFNLLVAVLVLPSIQTLVRLLSLRRRRVVVSSPAETRDTGTS